MDKKITRQSAVEVVEVFGEWFVRVTDGDEEQTLTFDLEAFALIYAEGQRKRLGLSNVTKL